MHWLIWLSLGILLAILEVFTPGFFVLGIGVSMAITAIPAALMLPLWLQLLVFGVSILVFFLLVRPLVMKIPFSEKKSGIEAMINKEGLVTEEIKPLEGGRVRVGGEEWKAQADERICENTVIVVERVEGVTLTVRRK